MNPTAQSIIALVLIWFIHAMIGGLPLLVIFDVSRRAWVINSLLLIVPFVGLIVAQQVWPNAGMSSYYLRLIILTAVVFVAAGLMVALEKTRGPVWSRVLVLAVAIGAVYPIHLFVPSLRD